MSISAKKLAFIAVFVATSVVTNIFTLPIGGSTVGISFAYLPVFLSGIFLGPITGFLVGILGDLLGCILHPLGPWIPFISVASGMIGLIGGLVFKIPTAKIIKKPLLDAVLKIFLGMFLVLIVCSAGLNTYGLWLFYSAGKKTFWVYLWGRLPFQALIVLINAALLCGLYPVAKKVLGTQTRI